MLFSSIIFIFYFLPVVLIVHSLIPSTRLRNIFLLVASLFFFAYGEVENVFVFLISVLVNYLCGLQIFKNHESVKSKIWLWVGVVFNVLVLFYFKYYFFLSSNINQLSEDFLPIRQIALPLGISFYTFHNISYLADVYKKKIHGEKSLVNLTLYISFFPQLIAGPIVRFVDVAQQIYYRKLNSSIFSQGVKRFVLGLAKKVLLANTFAEVADSLYGLNQSLYCIESSWLAIVFYTLQIYYDFSGYSDMAIGLAKMMGFHFKENFNYPYSSKSIQEFWRRWHISLSSWFRDYVYIPMGGNRVSKSRWYFNILFVFLLTGVWHGANWNFFLWGVIHGLFIILERTFLSKFIQSKYTVLQNIYLLFVVMLAWVFFRIESISDALIVIKSMFIQNSHASSLFNFSTYINDYVLVMLAVAIIFMYPQDRIIRFFFKIGSRFSSNISKTRSSLQYTFMLIYCILFFMSILSLSSGTYNPFIYFRF